MEKRRQSLGSQIFMNLRDQITMESHPGRHFILYSFTTVVDYGKTFLPDIPILFLFWLITGPHCIFSKCSFTRAGQLPIAKC